MHPWVLPGEGEREAFMRSSSLLRGLEAPLSPPAPAPSHPLLPFPPFSQSLLPSLYYCGDKKGPDNPI